MERQQRQLRFEVHAEMEAARRPQKAQAEQAISVLFVFFGFGLHGSHSGSAATQSQAGRPAALRRKKRKPFDRMLFTSEGCPGPTSFVRSGTPARKGGVREYM